MPSVQPIILSGGSGSRLWPASRSMYPKQLLPLTGEHTMLQSTVLRLDGIPDLAPRPIVVCNETHRFLVAQQLQALGREPLLLLEPEGRNTAPAIAIAALLAASRTDDDEASPTLLVLPADHVIEDADAFRAAVGVAAAAADDGDLVTFGVVPTGANTGYGYIRATPSGADAVRVREFVEKPDLATAEAYVAGGEHFWNSGMFVVAADRYLEELARHAPDVADACKAAMAAASSDPDFVRPERERFLGCRSDSIDYAVMEKTDSAMMVPIDAGWSDVGSWAALHEIAEKDDSGNAATGDALLHDCSGCLVSSESRLVTGVGLKDVIVVETKDSVLVANKQSSQDVKQLVEQLQQAEREEVALHRQVYRPWGSYDSIDAADGFQVKRLIVNPGAVLSLQMHHHRAEHWVVVRGTATITLNDDEFELTVNESTHIPVGATHRIANNGTEPVHIIEVQCGDYLGEDDIVRFEDKYGREGTNT